MYKIYDQDSTDASQTQSHNTDTFVLVHLFSVHLSLVQRSFF